MADKFNFASNVIAKVGGEDRTVTVKVENNHICVTDFKTKKQIIEFDIINTTAENPIIFVVSKDEKLDS
ncbi:MAG TPA: hypothetical protein DHM37_00465 [Candidatus Cloacimonas sp.]|jgi:hypothetical protein|nr:hypothetical protein [Candidatus Cloacimonadota bacterium]HCX72174.1 hypothetical protein [Candidatus Cloacimonas sp.]